MLIAGSARARPGPPPLLAALPHGFAGRQPVGATVTPLPAAVRTLIHSRAAARCSSREHTAAVADALLSIMRLTRCIWLAVERTSRAELFKPRIPR